MDKYEYRVKTEQMLEYFKQKEYEKAMEIADTVDWQRVKNASMLCSVSEIYELNEIYDKSRDILFVAYDRAAGSRKIVYRLGILALKIGDINEAVDCYEEFMTIAPKDPNQYILHYKILKAQNAPIAQQIETLADFKKAEYIEKWAYELARLYHEAGMTTECLAECDDLILWFSEGKYVYQAMELKLKYKTLTPAQQEKYDAHLIDVEQKKKNQFVKREPQGEALAAKIVKAAAAGKTVAKMEEDFVQEPMTSESYDQEPGIAEANDLQPSIQESVDREPGIPEAVAPESGIAEAYDMQPGVPEAYDAQPDSPESDYSYTAGTQTEQGKPENKQITGQMALEDLLGEKKEKPVLSDDIRALVEELEREEAEPVTIADAVTQTEPVSGDMDSSIQEEPQDIQEESLSMGQYEEPDEEYLDEDEEDEETDDGYLDDEYESYDGESERTDETQKSDKKQEPVPVPEPKAASQPKAAPEPEPTLSEELAKTARWGGLDDIDDLISSDKGPSRKAIAKAVATGKTAKLPVEEIAALTGNLPMDTGFIVQGRYDLDAQSEVGLRAGLTEEQKKLFSYFVPVRGMSEQLVDVLEQDKQCTNRQGSSKTGNLLIIGRKGSGKTVLAVDVVKAIQKGRNIKQGKVAIVTGEALNRKKVSEIIDKLYGGALIIEKASTMSEKTVVRLNKAMERDTGELLVVLEEQRRPLDALLASNKDFRRKFTSRLEVPIFINDELVTFGQTYAKENGYKIDEMGILALYSRIDLMQRDDHAVTVAEVKEIMDEAVAHSQKGNVKKLVKRVFGKNTDDSDRIYLTEKDFNI